LLLTVSSTVLAQGGPGGWADAQWVWDQPNANQVAQSNDPRYLRRTFELTQKVEAATLWVTADNRYTAYVNGKKVGSGKNWATAGKYDVAPLLVVGRNVLAIEAINEGGVAAAIARLHLRTADRKEQTIVTDARTKITQTAGKNWLDPAYDDSSWQAAIALGDATIAPWNLASGNSKTPQGFGYGVSAVDPTVKERLSAEKQKKHFSFPEGFALELVAADPLVINPITLAVDDQGRIYVSESHTYRYGPSGSPVKPFSNPVVRLERGADGQLRRTLVADGFDDPVMGIAVKGDQLWLTANNYLYRYDLTPEGKAINKKTLVVDKNKAWNPFGMFVLEWGPDGLLYMSVGNHVIDLQGPDGKKVGGRGSSGIVVRMNPDGSGIERLVHGCRVPYSFEYDPFGQLWVLSNGEGNPDRFLRVLDGVDYHCYSRPAVDNAWLAGNHPLAPPVFELGRGAHTQLMRYYGANFPEAYQGSLLLDNWGAHGFTGPNRAIFRFVPNARGDITAKETLLSCTDPHFRPSHIVLDTDGSLLVADWYGRDDESDMTGRIWRLKYVGKDRPAVTQRLGAKEWDQIDYAIAGLGSPDHRVRAKATDVLIGRGNAAVGPLADAAATSRSPLGAAHALWALLRIGTPEARASIGRGTENADWKVKRLALDLLRRYSIPGGSDVARKALSDADPAVRLESALALPKGEIAAALRNVIENGAANDAHLRYEAAWHLARHGDTDSFAALLHSSDADVQLAGLIAVDVACYEDFAPKAALAALRGILENPGKIDLSHVLTVAQLDGDASIVPSLQKLAAREDLSAAVTAKAILVLRAKAGNQAMVVSAAAGKRLLHAVQSGTLRVTTPTDQIALFDLLESDGPTPFALQQIRGQLHAKQSAVREAAHGVARRFGPKAAPLADALWPSVLNPKTKFDDAVESLATLARVEAAPASKQWVALLEHPDPFVRADAVRWWRQFKGQPAMIETLKRQAPALLKSDPALGEDLASVFTHLDATAAAELGLKDAARDKAELTRHTLAVLSGLSPGERKKRAALGQQVFERAACTKCHTTATQTTLLAPSLKGIGAAQKADYLIESVLFPSKVIKTGFESESVVTTSGKVLTGLVRDEGDALRVLNLDLDVRVRKTDVESRSVSRVSVMPEGQEAHMSSREFIDLIVYLSALK
jgi:putative membrane-bound dehydrogenase-like protein